VKSVLKEIRRLRRFEDLIVAGEHLLADGLASRDVAEQSADYADYTD
jgi:hypothetical protein